MVAKIAENATVAVMAIVLTFLGFGVMSLVWGVLARFLVAAEVPVDLRL